MGNHLGNDELTKILAIYLPQFHETEDNNLWWGKGFTEWTAVKKAEKLIPQHTQPKVPMGNNYYDLSKKDTMKWQAEIAEKYGIYGFSFYHYYFKDGKMELQLPAENLLRWKDIPMRFCFDWANAPWVRSWSKLAGEVWTEKFDKNDEGQAVLVEQDYGGVEEWEKHFEYLLPFFKDERYIKVDGKPVFIFHNPELCNCLEEMVKCWRSLAKKSGFEDLFLIGVTAARDFLDAAMMYEPRNAFRAFKERDAAFEINSVRCYEYSTFWDQILDTNPFYNYKTYYCALSGYDTTPRRGILGDVLINNTPSVFREKFVKLIQKSIKQGNEFVFIDAWNEWGEGMYIEPDEEHGYAYLEAVKEARIEAFEKIESYQVEHNDNYELELNRLNKEIDRLRFLSNVMNKWISLKEEEKLSFAPYLKSIDVCSVAIYGMGMIGKHLLHELNKENIHVNYGIDRNVRVADGLKIYRPESEIIPSVDAIIVTAYGFNDIYIVLKDKFWGKILYLEDILDELV